MKNILKKGSKFFLTALVILNSLMNTLPVHAEETTTDENDLDTIVELGNAEDVFPDLMPQSDGISLTDTTGTGSIYAMIHIANQYGFDYVQQLYVGDKTVFCIEPMQLFTEGLDFHQDTAKWDELSEQTRQNIWEINYYGYSYSGHQTEKYYVATQVMIWQAVTGTWYQPYYTDGTTVYDISNEVAVINNLRTQPQGRPSFNNQTIKMGLNTPVTLTDTKGTLANYSITNSNGIRASVNGNNLTVAITSENYDKSITFSRNFTARDVNVIYGSGGYQRVIYLASRRDPSPNFKLNFDLMYADIEVEKQDSQTGTKTQGDATFNGATFAIKDTNIDGVEIKANDYMALVEKDIVACKPNKLDALKVCLEKLVDEDSELITLLVGEDVVDEEVEEIESYIEDNFDAEVDIIEGKQPVYSFIIGVE